MRRSLDRRALLHLCGRRGRRDLRVQLKAAIKAARKQRGFATRTLTLRR
jgi:hypothetical protein